MLLDLAGRRRQDSDIHILQFRDAIRHCEWLQLSGDIIRIATNHTCHLKIRRGL